MAILGVTEHYILDLPDGDLPQHAPTGRARIGELLDEVRPDTILTFGPEGMTFHPDHISVHEWVTAEWRQRGFPCRLLYAVTSVPAYERSGATFEEIGAYMSTQRPSPVPVDQLALMVHPTGAALDQKIAALAAMSTQTAPLLSAWGWDGYAVHAAEEAYVEADRARRGEA
jgi:LmbE family N-acetylglucosaminyl deacetylase